MPFISVSCSIDVARIFSIVFNKSGKSRHPCLAHDLRGKAFNFSLLSVLLAVGLSYIAFMMLRNIHSTYNLLRVFIMKRC